MKDESDKVAEEVRHEQLERDIARLERVVSSLSDQLTSARRELAEVREIAEDAANDVDDLENSIDSADADSSAGAESEELDRVVGDSLPPHAYKVIVSAETSEPPKVYCFIPKDPDGTYFPAAMGGKHLGSSDGETADEHAGPYPAGGQGSGSDDPAPWAHYGWYEVGTLDTESGDVNDKIVVATFAVPVELDDSDSDEDPVEGPRLTDISLLDASGWENVCTQSWYERDTITSGEITRQVPIALVANGLVTQLTMTPYLDAAGADGDEWKADSQGEIYYSIDPPSKVPEWETEEVDQQKSVLKGKDIQGNPIYETKTIRVKQFKTDQDGNKIQKKDGQGHGLFQKTKYHQVHNFDTGNDNGLVEYAVDDYTGTQVACRITGEGARGSAEIFWRRIPKPCQDEYSVEEKTENLPECVQKRYDFTHSPCPTDSEDSPEDEVTHIDIPKPPEYSIDEDKGTLPECVAKRYVFTRSDCESDSDGSDSDEEVNIDIPKPPEYTVEVDEGSDDGECGTTYRLMREECGAEPGEAEEVGSWHIGGTFTAVTDAGIGTVDGTTCFWIEKTTFCLDSTGFSPVGDPVKTCVFEIDECDEEGSE